MVLAIADIAFATFATLATFAIAAFAPFATTFARAGARTGWGLATRTRLEWLPWGISFTTAFPAGDCSKDSKLGVGKGISGMKVGLGRRRRSALTQRSILIDIFPFDESAACIAYWVWI